MEKSLKGQISSLLGHLFFRSRPHVLTLRDFAPGLTFHRISDTSSRDILTQSSIDIKDFCAFLSSHIQVVPLSFILEKLRNGDPFRQELAITFDDGYMDNYELAAPILKTFHLPATFFITTQFIGSDFVPWWDEDLGVRHKWMTWDQVRALHRQGFEIGSHSRTHADLGKVPEVGALKELVSSRQELEDRLSAPVTLFSYPYGGPNNITKKNRELVKGAGYFCCCSCFGGVNVKGTNPYHLRRIPIASWYQSPQDFGFQLAMRRV
jgi:peptidoglycan/xylan/chitin deacetylase (PgdA/CDA1 family)